MTFQKYAAFFESDELDTLTAAYDAVWRDVWTTRAMNEAQAAVLTKRTWRRSFSLRPARANGT